MTLKQRLEAVWNSKHIASPCRFVEWRLKSSEGYQLEGLWYLKRRLIPNYRMNYKRRKLLNK